MIIKICGLSRLEEVKVAREADYIGFVMESPLSRRNISAKLFKELVEYVDSKSVIVTVTPEKERLQYLDSLEADVIQLHGKARKYKSLLNTPYALAVQYYEFEDDPKAEYIVVDNGKRTNYGGTGLTWDWKEIHKGSANVLVAGGITHLNFRDAIFKTHADGIDLSSSLETNGRKDIEKIRQFMEEIKIC